MSGFKKKGGGNWGDLPCLEKKMRRFSRDHLLILEEEAVMSGFVLFFSWFFFFFSLWNSGISSKGGGGGKSIEVCLKTLNFSGQLLSRRSITQQRSFFFLVFLVFELRQKALVGAIPSTKSLVKWCGWTSYLSEIPYSPIKRAFFPSLFLISLTSILPIFSTRPLH